MNFEQITSFLTAYRLPFLTSFVILLFVIGHNIRKGRRLQEKQEESFWMREMEADSTRRKPLDDLEFIRIPLETLPLETFLENEVVCDCVNLMKSLAETKIVNLTGLTNTDLKLKYGAANLTQLASFDENFMYLCQNLQKWSDVLWENGYRDEAAVICEYAVSIRADVGSVYRKLASYYKSKGEPERIKELIAVAETLQSASKKGIVEYLKEYTAEA